MSKAKKIPAVRALKETAHKDIKPSKRQQLAALCWRLHEGQPEVLLITSRDTGRWVMPKGWPMKGRTPWEAAATEAWEEAGVKGSVEDKPLGQFRYEKFLNRARSKSRECKVDVYPLHVEQLVDDFPEQAQRQREWFSPSEAAQRVDESELQQLLQAFSVKTNYAPVLIIGPAPAPLTGEKLLLKSQPPEVQALDPIGAEQARA